jgi:hypothetical protein
MGNAYECHVRCVSLNALISKTISHTSLENVSICPVPETVAKSQIVMFVMVKLGNFVSTKNIHYPRF